MFRLDVKVPEIHLDVKVPERQLLYMGYIHRSYLIILEIKIQ